MTDSPGTLSRLLGDWGQYVDPELLVLAMTHRSFAHENGMTGSEGSNERLEFLGDAVLQIVVTDYLYRAYPDLPEKDLSRMRAATVSETPLAQAARRIDLGRYLLLGVGEDRNGGRDKPSLLSDAYEALIGATYLSAGLEATRTTIEKQLRILLRRADQRAAAMDWRSTLKELCEKHRLGELHYEITDTGPAHHKTFTATVFVGQDEYGSGQGSSKKQAELVASEQAVRSLHSKLGLDNDA